MGRGVPIRFREILRVLAEDRRVLQECYKVRGVEIGCILWTPPYVCVTLYRLARYCYVRGWKLTSRFFWQINLLLTGADVSPLSDLGDGLLIVHPVAVVICGSAGSGLVVEGFGGMGGGMEMHDIGAGPGLPLLGNNVELAHGAMVLGPVAIGNGVRIGPGCTVTRDVPDYSEVLEQPIRIRRTASEGTHDAA